MKNILDSIVDEKRREVALLPPGKVTSVGIRKVLAARPERRDFLAALRLPWRGPPALIAEIKKASPSAGLICPDFDAAAIAREYEAAGAACLSVLTDQKFFHGSGEDLKAARTAVKLPILRKDFIIDERQILEAAQWGADAVLLIARILDDRELKHFHRLATEAGLAALVEVHNEAELDRALAAGATLIGVNNRDLDTLEVDMEITERLAARVANNAFAGEILLVSESGLHARADVARVERAGAAAILVGESLLKSPRGIAAKVNELLTGA